MKSFSRHKANLLTAIHNGLSILFVWVCPPINTSDPQQPCYHTKNLEKWLFLQIRKSETKLEIKAYLSVWTASYHPFKKLFYLTQQMFIYVDIFLTLY